MNYERIFSNRAETIRKAVVGQSSPKILLLVGLLSLTSAQSSCDGGDEEDWVDPTGDDDDVTDDDDPIPWETNAKPGSYSGTSTGIVRFTGAGQYPCAGTVTVVLDDDLLATGEVDCIFTHNGESCGLTFDGLALDGGPQSLDVECHGSGIGSLSTWTGSDTAVGGRWYRGGEVISVEFNWYATLDEEF